MHAQNLGDIADDQPVLIAGPTASGKTALALRIAQTRGGVIVNADASQVFDCWRIITARPSAEEETCALHHLFGHVAYDTPYSAGHWARDLRAVLAQGQRPIIVGGTGLYFAAATEGLAEIPATPQSVREQGDARSLDTLQSDLDPLTKSQIDLSNRARVQRAWEVQKTTGIGLAQWQLSKSDPLVDPSQAAKFVLDAPKDWLNPRIEQRLHNMLAEGAIDEVKRMIELHDPRLPSFRAIGVPELIDYISGKMDLEDAQSRIIIATRQYAKRQRTWFRKRCIDWHWLKTA